MEKGMPASKTPTSHIYNTQRCCNIKSNKGNKYFFPNTYLVEFRDKYAPELEYDDPRLFFLLIKEINKMKGEREGDKK